MRSNYTFSIHNILPPAFVYIYALVGIHTQVRVLFVAYCVQQIPYKRPIQSPIIGVKKGRLYLPVLSVNYERQRNETAVIRSEPDFGNVRWLARYGRVREPYERIITIGRA